jgi:hypothetical protein
MTGQANDNVHAASRIVNELHTRCFVLTAIPMCGSVRRRPISSSYFLTRCVVNATP